MPLGNTIIKYCRGSGVAWCKARSPPLAQRSCCNIRTLLTPRCQARPPPLALRSCCNVLTSPHHVVIAILSITNQSFYCASECEGTLIRAVELCQSACHICLLRSIVKRKTGACFPFKPLKEFIVA